MPNKIPEQKKKAESAVQEPVKIIGVAAKPKVSKAGTTGSMIRFCSCVNAYQDAKYGKGRRVFTLGPKNGMHCTACGARV